MKMQIQFIGRDDSPDDLQDVFTEMRIEGNRPLCKITDQGEHDSLTVAQVSKHLVSLASHDDDEVFDALITVDFLSIFDAAGESLLLDKKGVRFISLLLRDRNLGSNRLEKRGLLNFEAVQSR